MIEHKFIFHSLEKLGFGDFFCNAIKTLHANCHRIHLMIKSETGHSSGMPNFCFYFVHKYSQPISLTVLHRKSLLLVGMS